MRFRLARFRLAAAVLAVLLASGPVRAAEEHYPSRPITILTPFAAGSVTDAAARLVAQTLQEALGQSVVVENRAGAGGLIAASAVARAKPDGYTLLLTTNSTHSVVYGLYKSVPYDPLKDFTPIARIGSFPSFVAVHPAQPIKTMEELVARAKKKPGTLSYGVGNSTAHIVGETIKRRTGIDLTRVPYKSNPAAMTDLIAGHIPLMIPDFNTGLPQLREGKIRALAVLTRERNKALPDVPTLDESVMAGFDIMAWAGLFGPAGMPPQATATLAREVENALAREDVRARFTAGGTDPYWSGPEAFARFVETELSKWTALIKEAGIQPE